MSTLALALVIVGGVLAVVELARSRLGSLLSWGVLAIAAGVALALG